MVGDNLGHHFLQLRCDGLPVFGMRPLGWGGGADWSGQADAQDRADGIGFNFEVAAKLGDTFFESAEAYAGSGWLALQYFESFCRYAHAEVANFEDHATCSADDGDLHGFAV